MKRFGVLPAAGGLDDQDPETMRVLELVDMEIDSFQQEQAAQRAARGKAAAARAQRKARGE